MPRIKDYLTFGFLTCLCVFTTNDSSCQTSSETLQREYDEILKYSRTKPLSAITKIASRLEMHRANNNALGMAYSYLSLYWSYTNFENYKHASIYLDSMEQVIKSNNLSSLKIELYNAKSRNFYDKDNTASNLLVIDSFYQEALIRNDSFNMGGALALKANAYQTRSEFDKAVEYFDKALVLFNKMESEKGLQSVYSMMGNYYGRRAEFRKGRKETLASLKIANKRKDTLGLIRGLSNLSGIYALEKNLLKTKETIDRRNALIDQTEYPKEKKHSINIAIFYIESQLFNQGLQELSYVEEYYERNPNLKRQALVKHWKSIAYRGLNDYHNSAINSKSAFAISQQIQHLALSQITAYTLFQTYHWRDKNKQAIEWLIKSQEIKDTIYSQKKISEILKLETKYETLRKEQEITILKANAELNRTKRNQLWTILFTITGLGLFCLYTLNLKRVKDKQLQIEKLKIIELEKNQLEQQLSFKEKELTTQLLHVAKKNEQLINISEILNTINLTSTESGNLISKLQRQIKSDLNSSEVWEQFIHSFKSIHKNFIHTMVDHFSLTSGELRLASLVKMNMNNKEIANLLNITNEGIKKARYRLRKKMKLKVGESLDELILSIQ